MLEKVQIGITWLQNRATTQESDQKFGTFAGVFTPAVLTILGAIMYLRLGQVVGNAGLIGALLIILMAHVITVSTGLSVSSISTNTRVGAGGAFAIISKALGVEVGGAIGVPLFLAQGISVALYVLAFGEGWLRIFPAHNYKLVCIAAFILVFVIAYISTSFAFRIQFFILTIVGFSLFSIFLGSFAFAGRIGLTQTPILWGEFSKWDFWTTFAIFFPAVTGIMAGISMSGSLKAPRKSLPEGTMSAIGLTMVVYLALAYWLSRAATSAELLATETIMVDKAFWGWAILAGILGATFSSALGSLVAAPRVMQALAQNQLLPFSKILARETANGEPRPAMIANGAIGLVALILALSGGGLNAIAGVISMFFIITYGMLNVVVFIEQMLNMVSFRPTFRVPRSVPFIGMMGCLFVMFLINPIFSLIAIVLVVALYLFLARRTLAIEGSDDVRSGLFVSIAEWAANKAIKMPSAPERAWKPSVLVPVSSVGELNGSYRFLRAMTWPQGTVNSLGIYAPGEEEKLANLTLYIEAFLNEGISAQKTLLEDADFINGVRTATQVLRGAFFRPNLLFLHLRRDSKLRDLRQLIDKTAAYRMGIILLARHSINDLGREQIINVWISPPPDWRFTARAGSNDLSILLALQLQKNWEGQINLCMAVDSEEAILNADTLLDELITLARLPGNTQKVILQSTFEPGLTLAPQADLSIIGLPKEPDLTFFSRLVDVVDGSCVFVRDSGDESALA
ncbi:MAG: amino acid permease [Anaerolineales bacterium]|nr:amino acid permease [Anaerolineales bacterium]MCB8939299.1 amino acid permease [Ardenticatenaceae bacterium]